MKLEDVKKVKLYTTHEAAEFMGIDYYALHRLIKAGRIKVINTGFGKSKATFKITAKAIQQYYDSLENDDTIEE